MNKLSFHYFHLMPWPYLPPDFDGIENDTGIISPCGDEGAVVDGAKSLTHLGRNIYTTLGVD